MAGKGMRILIGNKTIWNGNKIFINLNLVISKEQW